MHAPHRSRFRQSLQFVLVKKIIVKSSDPKDAQIKYNEEKKKIVGVPEMIEDHKSEPVVPFPRRFMQSKAPHQEVLDMFKGIKINIPLLEAINRFHLIPKF